MKYPLSNHDVVNDRTSIVSAAVWVGILVLTGTYFRVRSADAVPETDWLVTAQLLICCLGGVLGISLIKKQSSLGIGTKVLIGYVISAGLSAIFSPYPKIVVGYWILLAGASLLTIGLTESARTQKALNRIENIWLLIITLLLAKDTVIAIFFQDFSEIQEGSEPYRLGMGLTHANEMSLLATLAFWVSFKEEGGKRPLVLWITRAFFILVILLTRTRIAIIGFMTVVVVYHWFRYGFKRLHLRIIIFCLFLSGICIGILALSFELNWATTAFRFFNRYQDVDTILSFTGRTEIWFYAIKKVFESPISLFFGHGYGISRLVINEEMGGPSFYASHTHNTLIEVILTMGLLGFIPFIIMIALSLRWLTRFRILRQEFSTAFTLRAISVMCIILVSFTTEAYLGMKIGPIGIIYLFYFLALDRRKDLIR
jgi:O-antigen ligase